MIAAPAFRHVRPFNAKSNSLVFPGGASLPPVAATAAICVSPLAKPVAKFRFSKVNFNITQLGLWITEPLPKESELQQLITQEVKIRVMSGIGT
jgi:hypothetical protein